MAEQFDICGWCNKPRTPFVADQIKQTSCACVLLPRCLLCDSKSRRIAELEAALRWIPVSEKLPERGTNVLLAHLSYNDKFYCQMVGQLREGLEPGELAWFTHDDCSEFERVKYWMPLQPTPVASSASQSPATEVANSNAKGDPNCAG